MRGVADPPLLFFLLSPQEYLSAALKYLDEAEKRGGEAAKDIKGIWVASDSPNAVREVRALAPDFFPTVPQEAIVWISGGNNGGRVSTHSKVEVRSMQNSNSAVEGNNQKHSPSHGILPAPVCPHLLSFSDGLR